MKPDASTFDNRDDRREIATLLAKLTPYQRFAFLSHCCTQSQMGVAPNISRMNDRIEKANRGDEQADNALTNEIYFDLYTLAMQYGLSLRAITADLERKVKELR